MEMSYKALYRTYRPMTFEEVAGQQHIVKTLQNALKENKIAHAYLFCGPRGTGKTSLARLFAKALNCEHEFGHQCNECENCIAINEGTHPDVIEIDAASNRGIDDIRDLIDRVKYAPIKGTYKVYIIDEVHMLTTEAFNALLKTLEEPPSNVVFILATTEPYKLMPTILSRCQRYDFMKVNNEDLLHKLEYIVKKENISASGKALSLIVSLADGGVRDALSMLDQAIAYSGDNLEESHINELFGLTSNEEKINLLQVLKNGDIVKVTAQTHKFIENGADIRRLTQDLLDILKDLLIARNTTDDSLLKLLTRDDCLKLDNFTNVEINEVIDMLLGALMQYKFVGSINSLFEITLLKITSILNRELEDDKTKVISKKEQDIEVVKPEVKAVKVIKEESVPLKIFGESEIPDFCEFGNQIDFNDEDILNIMIQANKTEKQFINGIWEELNEFADPKLSKYAATIRGCFPRVVSKNAIILEAPFDNLVKKTNFAENQEGFREVIYTLTKRNYLIICLSHDKYSENVQKFRELYKLGQLPKPKEISLEIRIRKGE